MSEASNLAQSIKSWLLGQGSDKGRRGLSRGSIKWVGLGGGDKSDALGWNAQPVRLARQHVRGTRVHEGGVGRAVPDPRGDRFVVHSLVVVARWGQVPAKIMARS